MVKAVWNQKTLAESDETVIVEGNHYFPFSSVNEEFLKKSGTQYTCPWKGTCDYYDIVVDGKINKEAAWIYPDPKPAAKEIKGCVAFWKGVEVRS